MVGRRRTDPADGASKRAMLGLVILAIGLIVSAALSAEERHGPLSYTYLDGSYVNSDFDQPMNLDGDGVRMEGSLAVTEHLFLLGDYTTQDLDFGADLDQVRLGVGGRLPVATRLDVVGSVDYQHTELDVGPADTDDDTFGLGLGLRGALTDRLELEGGVRYADVDILEDDLRLSLSGRYYLLPRLALGAGVDAGDDMSIWNLGVRYDFR